MQKNLFWILTLLFLVPFHGFSQVCNVPPPAMTTFGMQLAWQSDVDPASMDEVSPMVTPTVGDLNNDGIPEIITCSKVNLSQFLTFESYEVYIFQGDGSDLSNPVILNVTVPSLTFCPVIADIGNGGLPELIFVDSWGNILIYENFNGTSMSPMPISVVDALSNPAFADNFHNVPNVIDFDGNLIPEIYIGNNIFQFNTTFTQLTKVIDLQILPQDLNGNNHSIGWGSQSPYFPIAADVLPSTFCANCSGPELILGPKVFAVNLSLPSATCEVNINDTSAIELLDGYMGIADLDLDGDVDVVVNGTVKLFPSGPEIPATYAYDPVNSQLLRTFFGSSNPNDMIGKTYGGKVCIGNVFDDIQVTPGFVDDFPEILVVGDAQMNAYNLNPNMPNGDAVWRQSVDEYLGHTAPVVFDFNADGFKEIVYRDHEHLRVMYGGHEINPGNPNPYPTGVDPDRNWATALCKSGTSNEHPVVADVDADGIAEIVTTGGPLLATTDGTLQVYEHATFPWASTRTLWNQPQYFVMNVNDDLTVPANQSEHHLEDPPGSGVRPTNLFLGQACTYNPDGFAVPDAVIEITGYSCSDQTVTVEICNLCNQPQPANTGVTFYSDDPQTSSLPTWEGTFFTSTLIPGSGCITETYVMPNGLSGISQLWVVVNDDHSAASYPLTPATSFPMSNPQIWEGSYANNFHSLQLECSSPCDQYAPAFSWAFQSIANPNQVTFFDNTVPYNDIAFWMFGDGTTATVFHPSNTVVHTYANPGTYWVCMLGSYYDPSDPSSDPCPQQLVCHWVTVNSSTRKTGEPVLRKPDLAVYPVPAHASIYVETGWEGEAMLSIESVTGQQLHSRKINCADKVELDISFLAKGVYFLRVEGDSERVVKKIIKE